MKFILILYLVLSLLSDSYQEDDDICLTSLNENECVAAANDDHYCCFLTSLSEDFSECLDSPDFIQIFAEENLKAISREYLGYNLEGENILKVGEENKKMNVTCKNFKTELDSSIMTFSEEENEILQNQQHCFNLHNNTIWGEMEATKELCKDGIFTEYAKKAGLKCAYANLTFVLQNKNQNFKTCFPILKEDIESKKLNKFTKYYLDNNAEQVGAASYIFSAIAEGEPEISYDSKTGKLDIESKSDMVNISKYFIILFLFIF